MSPLPPPSWQLRVSPFVCAKLNIAPCRLGSQGALPDQDLPSPRGHRFRNELDVIPAAVGGCSTGSSSPGPGGLHRDLCRGGVVPSVSTGARLGLGGPRRDWRWVMGSPAAGDHPTPNQSAGQPSESLDHGASCPHIKPGAERCRHWSSSRRCHSQ